MYIPLPPRTSRLLLPGGPGLHQAAPPERATSSFGSGSLGHVASAVTAALRGGLCSWSSSAVAPAVAHELRRREDGLTRVNTTVGVAVGVVIAVFIAGLIAFLWVYRKSIVFNRTYRRRHRHHGHRKSSSSKSSKASSDGGAPPPTAPPPAAAPPA